MDVFLADWLNLLLRWIHLIVGIGWIGTSFYFMALDYQLRRRPDAPPGVMGAAWLVHGGGFYDVQKYAVAPPQLPSDLIWYKWDAYLTFLTGMLLLAVQYYWHANVYLIDPAKLALTSWQAIAISAATLAAGWFLYDALCRSRLGDNEVVLAVVTFALIMGASALFLAIFSGRGAFIHIGSFIGTIMAANVFRVIIPNQKKIAAALIAGETPDPRLGKKGKQRSTHNNYLTLPVLVMMVSNHYPFLHSHPASLVVVALVLVSGASIRHFMNRHDAGDPLAKFWWAAPVGALALVAAIVLTAPKAGPARQVTDARALELTHTHCIACHAKRPTHESFNEPPKDVVLETLADLRRWAPLMLAQVVQAQAMPLGNETEMSEDERAELGAWLVRQ